MDITLNFLPERTKMPRTGGITMVMDKGLGMRQAEDMVETAGNLIDFLKLGFGTSYVNPNVKDKIALYQRNGIKVYPGGTLFEAFCIRNQFDDYRRFVEKLGFDSVEISDGSMTLNHDKKCEYIRVLSKEYTVVSEVGSKVAGLEIPIKDWIIQMKSELEAGSFKTIAEARESGTVGIYDLNGKANYELISEISKHLPFESIIWEAPLKSQQAWFIKHFGANVNLGNIAPSEIIPMETLRLGLRGDTFLDFLPDELKE
ncbi:MAG: phosphosulfolactate synthase [Bacteroidales bacterium]|nr:phosphosulfolactate synthase [Bacteroidales bacterium]